ncbi:MAG: SDR family oxidoreductase [Lentimicrobium sp.]|jgi:3-oxoacyl-[acyl-carrier protein] reductase|nr:SDR family oxidoreductase [Lentimicrobium sp.]
MDLDLKDKLFVVLGASSGFGKAISERLIQENAQVIAVARRADLLRCQTKPDCERYIAMQADVVSEGFIDNLVKQLDGKTLHGIVLNAGGPPAGGFMEIKPEQWMDAFHQVFFWKVKLLQQLIPIFSAVGYGRIVLIESVSVKQPVKQLVLSNAFRAAVAGMVRTLADEVAGNGITINIMAPGYHETDAMKRLFVKKSETLGIGLEEARELFAGETGTGSMGNPDHFAELAAWLLSPSSGYITGQVISVSGNLVKGIMG